MVVNAGSCRVLERVGFRRTAVHVLEWPEPHPGAEQGKAEYLLELPCAPGPAGDRSGQPR